MKTLHPRGRERPHEVDENDDEAHRGLNKALGAVRGEDTEGAENKDDEHPAVHEPHVASTSLLRTLQGFQSIGESTRVVRPMHPCPLLKVH